MDHQALAQLLGNYGEFVGAIAVVITLAYLATQIRQNTRSNYVVRGDLARGRLFAINESVMHHQELAELVSQSRDPVAGTLKPAEEERVERIAQNYVIIFGGVESAHRNAEMSEEEYGTFCDEFRRIIETYPGLGPRMKKILAPLGERPAAYKVYKPLFE
jgi:hypothetical protein